MNIIFTIDIAIFYYVFAVARTLIYTGPVTYPEIHSLLLVVFYQKKIIIRFHNITIQY